MPDRKKSEADEAFEFWLAGKIEKERLLRKQSEGNERSRNDMQNGRKNVSLSDTYIKGTTTKQKRDCVNVRKTAPETGKRCVKLVHHGFGEPDEAFKAWLHEKVEKERELRRQKENDERIKKQLEEERKRMRAEDALLDRKMWLSRKAEEKKRVELKKQKLLEMEERKRKEKYEESKEFVRMWMEKSRNKPKAVRSNNGLTSLFCRNNVRPLNPVPWKNLIECGAN